MRTSQGTSVYAMTDDSEKIVDLTAVRADDQLLDDLAAGRRPSDEPVVRMLADWREVVGDEKG